MRPFCFALLLFVGCLTGTVSIAQTPPPSGAQTPPSGAQTPPSGTVPPRDPRLAAPKAQETTVPPVIVVPPPPVLPDVPQRPLTAGEAARLALRFQPNILNARASLFAQQGRTRQVRAGLLPQLSLSASYTHIETISGAAGGGVGVAGGGAGTTTGGGGGAGGSTGTGSTPGTGNQGGTGTGQTGTGQTGTGTTPGTGGTPTTGNTSGTPGSSTGTTPGTGNTGNTGSTSGSGGTSTGGTTAISTSSAGGVSGLSEGFSAQASLRQLIFDFNHTRDLVRQSVALERAAAQNLTRVQYDTVFNVKQGFYQYVQNRRLVTVNEQEVANRQAQLDLALARYNVGLGQPGDVLTAQTAKAEAILNLTVARANAEQARIALALLIGVDARTPIVPADTTETPFPSEDVNAFVAQGLRQRPEVLQAQETLRAYGYATSAARTTNAPVVSGNASLLNRGDQVFPQNNYFSIGLSVTWTPLDGGLTRGRVEEARANVLAAQSQLTAAQLTVSSDVSAAYVNLRTAEERVSLAEADVANAQESARIAEGRYRTGIGQFIDIINAQAFLLTARTNLVTTQTLIPLYRAALARAVGTPLTP